MGRRPGETPAQWFTRATGEYLVAMAVLQVEWQRLSTTSLSKVIDGYPTSDDTYDGAMDSLEDADNERVEAANELDRQSLAALRPAPRVKRRSGERFDNYHE